MTVGNEELDYIEAELERAKRYIALGEAFIHGITWCLGLFPIAYGLLTLLFGDKLWGSAITYQFANSVPYAPQSWGTYAIIAGIFIIVGELSNPRSHKAIMIGTGAMAIWCMFFSSTFLIDSIRNETPFGLPGTVIYGITGIMMITRFELARRWRLQ